MLKHIVVIKCNEGVDKKQIAELQERLVALPAQINEIKGFVFGADILKTRRSYDYALVALFDDVEALARYQQHPAHIPVLELVSSLASSVIVVDFEVQSHFKFRFAFIKRLLHNCTTLFFVVIHAKADNRRKKNTIIKRRIQRYLKEKTGRG